MMAWAIGCIPPPPAPWIARAISRKPKLGAMPQTNEAVVNSVMQIRKKRLRPTTLVIHPVMGSMIAFATRYVVSTHVPWSRLAPRFPAMWGSATFAMLVSRTSMKAAMATTTAISHGLNFGFHS